MRENDDFQIEKWRLVGRKNFTGGDMTENDDFQIEKWRLDSSKKFQTFFQYLKR